MELSSLLVCIKHALKPFVDIFFDSANKVWLVLGLFVSEEKLMWRLARCASSNLSRSLRRRCFYTAAIPGPCIVHKRGTDILHDPWFNKVNNSLSLSLSFDFCNCIFKIAVPAILLLSLPEKKL